MTTEAPEQVTPTEWVIVMRLCKFDEGVVGPFAWLCRLAWCTLVAGQPFDTDAAIAENADWLDKPENATGRANIVGCIDFIRKVAAKTPLWQLPEVDGLFDPSDWFTS